MKISTCDLIAFLPLLAFLAATTVPVVADPTAPTVPSASAAASRVVQGELLKMDGDSYIVKDKSGAEVRLRVDKETLLDARVQVGDKIDATVTAEGRTASILKVP